MFTLPLNFSQKEQLKDLTVSFDKNKIKSIIKVEDFKAKLLEVSNIKMEINEENMYNDNVIGGGVDYKVE